MTKSSSHAFIYTAPNLCLISRSLQVPLFVAKRGLKGSMPLFRSFDLGTLMWPLSK